MRKTTAPKRKAPAPPARKTTKRQAALAAAQQVGEATCLHADGLHTQAATDAPQCSAVQFLHPAPQSSFCIHLKLLQPCVGFRGANLDLLTRCAACARAGEGAGGGG